MCGSHPARTSKPSVTQSATSASRGERSFARRVGTVEEVLARLKHSATGDQERRDRAGTAVRRRTQVPRHVAGDDEVTVVRAVYIDEFGSDADPRQQVPSSGAPDETFAHDTVIRESDPASRKVHGGSRPILRDGQVGHRCRQQDEHDDGDSGTLSTDACASHRPSPLVAA